ncbi:L-rhamnose isomerase [Acinetobacter baylyi]|uniref:L-rhamnose isomerase n=1 Tax=Acinetobacter baylyi TaxID=202950 RepID=A0ABU0URV6_ACIBI|nr:ORF6N domain-containing protein [Acinetobacter baylyi]MDQ1207280.1 L-rhamnose isomerase [Acinetobacter baylyi]MDR6105638.1 L-rhamnose isomerase [Acinetobacter baylyi]MDR6187641.1 L-rhamnose isomerase [Acinetobacter baylyi]
MPNIAQINDTQVSIINFNSIPVVTTEMLADFYQTDAKHIQNNYLRNSGRFIEGKHFFKLVGEQLKKFKNLPSLRGLVNKRTPHLTLWTERGAARHAKMLDTDQAWEVFEQLEDCYFHRQEILAKTHKSEREPLTNAVNLLVAKTKHLNYSEAYKLVHQRFNVEHIEEIPFESIPVAVEYVHHLIAMYSKADNQTRIEYWKNRDVQMLMYYAPKFGKFVRDDLYPALSLLRSEFAIQVIGMAQEMATSANALNRQAWGWGVTHYDELGGQPLHTMEWYLAK